MLHNNDTIKGIITLSFIVNFSSCFCRVFLDNVEKYLFEFNYLNPYKVMMLERFINSFFILILFLFNEYVVHLTDTSIINIDEKDLIINNIIFYIIWI